MKYASSWDNPFAFDGLHWSQWFC